MQPKKYQVAPDLEKTTPPKSRRNAILDLFVSVPLREAVDACACAKVVKNKSGEATAAV